MACPLTYTLPIIESTLIDISFSGLSDQELETVATVTATDYGSGDDEDGLCFRCQPVLPIKPRLIGPRIHSNYALPFRRLVGSWIGCKRDQHRIVHRLVCPTSVSAFENFIGNIHRRSRVKPESFLVARHKEEKEGRTHYHFLHHCPWNYRSCHCFDDIQFNIGALRSTGGENYSVDNAIRQLFYVHKGAREIIYYKAGQDSWRQVCRAERVQFDRCAKCTTAEEMDKGVDEDQECVQGTRCSVQGYRQASQENLGSLRAPRRQDRISSAELATVMRKLMVTPVENTYLCKTYNENDRYKHIMPGDKLYQRAVQEIRTWLTNVRSIDLDNHYASLENPIFENINPSHNKYYDPEYSAFLAYELLTYQFGEYDNPDDLLNPIDAALEFISSLEACIDKGKAKENTLQIVSPPSSGKNFFFDPIFLYYGNVGRIGNFNRFNQFPLQECPNRRILYWNEPNFEPAALDTLKMLLGGDMLPAKVKHQGDQTVYRTPVIITTNKEVFPNIDAFNHRMCTYYWKEAPYLKKYDKKLHPLMWPILKKKFNDYRVRMYATEKYIYTDDELEGFGTSDE